MQKLSEIEGQEHITLVLRASVVAENPIRKMVFWGDRDTSKSIVSSYRKALSCRSPIKGDWCGECKECKRYPSWTQNDVTVSKNYNELFVKTIYVSYNEAVPGFVEFVAANPMGSFVDKMALEHLVYAVTGNKPAALKLGHDIAITHSMSAITIDYLNAFKNMLYLQNNLEIMETEKLSLLTDLANKLPASKISACMRLLWDSEFKTTLPERSQTEVLLSLLYEIISPSPTINLEFEGNTEKKAIDVVEEKSEQPLSVDEMLRIARE